MSRTARAIMAAALASGLWLATISPLRADTFGSGADTFAIDFVTVGNPGNSDDAGAGGGNYSSPFGGVSYTYRIGVHEISQDMIAKATNLGLTHVTAGAWGANQPATNMTWYEAAAFVNWLNTSKGYPAAYNLTYNGTWSLTLWDVGERASTGVDSGTNPYRHKDAYYFLPSEDEWYKAAYQQNDGATANYWDYATGSNAPPTAVANGTGTETAVYKGATGSPAAVEQAGGLSPYGTMGQNGNVWEWNESALNAPNDSASEVRVIRGGTWLSSESGLRASVRGGSDPSFSLNDFGFRVASIPEPSTALLVSSGLGVLLLRRHRFGGRGTASAMR